MVRLHKNHEFKSSEIYITIGEQTFVFMFSIISFCHLKYNTSEFKDGSFGFLTIWFLVSRLGQRPFTIPFPFLDHTKSESIPWKLHTFPWDEVSTAEAARNGIMSVH